MCQRLRGSREMVAHHACVIAVLRRRSTCRVGRLSDRVGRSLRDRRRMRRRSRRCRWCSSDCGGGLGHREFSKAVARWLSSVASDDRGHCSRVHSVASVTGQLRRPSIDCSGRSGGSWSWLSRLRRVAATCRSVGRRMHRRCRSGCPHFRTARTGPRGQVGRCSLWDWACGAGRGARDRDGSKCDRDRRTRGRDGRKRGNDRIGIEGASGPRFPLYRARFPYIGGSRRDTGGWARAGSRGDARNCNATQILTFCRICIHSGSICPLPRRVGDS